MPPSPNDHRSGYLRVRGARVHNLKNVDVDLPREKLVVLTGLSGSGKSSLAFDTIYAEGQRRYVESLSAYARQFLGTQEKPDVDLIEGLSPAISIEQKTTARNPRSTVATVTEIYDYLRLLYARAGTVHCYKCDRPISQRSATQIVNDVMELPEGTKLAILSPIVRARKGEYKAELKALAKEGFVRVRIDGHMRELDGDEIQLDKQKKHSIEIVIDRIAVRPDARSRVADSIELALKKSEGLVILQRASGDEELHSTKFACPDCSVSYPELEPRSFSFNAPQGACTACSGLGNLHRFDPKLVVPDGSKSLEAGAIRPWSGAWQGFYIAMLKPLAKEHKFKLNTKWDSLAPDVQKLVLYGTNKEYNFKFEAETSGNEYQWKKKYEGVIPNLDRRFKETDSENVRGDLEKYMSRAECPDCKGARLRPESRAVRVGGTPIHILVGMSVADAYQFMETVKLGERERVIAAPVLKEVLARLEFLRAVGLQYLTLDRAAGSLSGGEAQRIRLASQIGSGLVGVLYVLDEPSIGLHQRDNERLLATLRRLRDLGNTVIVVEHDEDTIRAADYVLDLGPGAGSEGGHVVAAGTPEAIMASKSSITGRYLSRTEMVPVPANRRKGNGNVIALEGATGNNLKNVELRIPLGTLTCVTGVSGSGKSTLVIDTLKTALSHEVNGAAELPLAYKRLSGLENIDKMVDIDQSPIGRTPRSNPVTYTGIFDEIRRLFAATADARAKGYEAGRFSFNVSGGRCESCQGDGLLQIDMNFLADVYVTCEVCRGARYNPETLSVLFKGKNIAEVLRMTVREAVDFFAAVPTVKRKLDTLFDVGLGYVQLGQSATTLSGGEAQRIKLSKELGKRATGKTLYILDEPTTGLHFHDVKQLLEVLHRFVADGNTVLVIEHNLDVIKTADHIVDLGPEGGALGGEILATGTPEMLACNPRSHTGAFLRATLARDGIKLPPLDTPGAAPRSSTASRSAKSGKTQRSNIASP